MFWVGGDLMDLNVRFSGSTYIFGPVIPRNCLSRLMGEGIWNAEYDDINYVTSHITTIDFRCVALLYNSNSIEHFRKVIFKPIIGAMNQYVSAERFYLSYKQ